MQFTIITPSLNYGRFLGDCLESVAAQEGVTLEHLVIDGGSSDDSREVASRFPHVTWRQEPDEGMSDAINKGFDRACGEWVMWLNADDILLPGTLSKVAAFVREHPTVDIVHGDCVFVRSDRSVIRRKYDHPMDEWTLAFNVCWIPTTSTFLNRKILDAGIRLAPQFKNSMDLEFYLRLLRLGYKFGYIAEPLAEFRWHEGNLSVLHDARQRAEDLKIQRGHLAERGLPTFLGWRPVLAILRRLTKVRRIALRWRTHRRLI